MTSTSTAHERSSAAAGDATSTDASVRSTADALPRLLKPLEVVGFWAGVALPFLYVPLLVTGRSDAELFASLILIAVHVVALYVGHTHTPGDMG